MMSSGTLVTCGQLHPPFQKPVLAADELMLDEVGEEIGGRKLLGLRVDEAGLEAVRDAGAAELAEGALQFDDVQEGVSSLFCAMTSR
jgi:hypothetical protein